MAVRWGVVFRPQLAPVQLRPTVEAAEAAGLDDLWLWEDCFLEGGLTTATAALAWSERLRVGVGLLPVPLRNPAVVAMELATVAALFPGRFVVGLGHGVQAWMAQVGAQAASPLTLLREHTIAVQELLAGATVTTHGRYVDLDDVTLAWPPAAPPLVMIGGRGPKTLRLAGEVAAGTIFDAGAGPTDVRAGLTHVEAGRTAAGRAGDHEVVVYVELPDGPFEAATAERLGALVDAGATTVVLQSSETELDPGRLVSVAGEAKAAVRPG